MMNQKHQEAFGACTVSVSPLSPGRTLRLKIVCSYSDMNTHCIGGVWPVLALKYEQGTRIFIITSLLRIVFRRSCRMYPFPFHRYVHYVVPPPLHRPSCHTSSSQRHTAHWAARYLSPSFFIVSFKCRLSLPTVNRPFSSSFSSLFAMTFAQSSLSEPRHAIAQIFFRVTVSTLDSPTWQVCPPSQASFPRQALLASVERAVPL